MCGVLYINCCAGKIECEYSVPNNTRLYSPSIQERPAAFNKLNLYERLPKFLLYLKSKQTQSFRRETWSVGDMRREHTCGMERDIYDFYMEASCYISKNFQK